MILQKQHSVHDKIPAFRRLKGYAFDPSLSQQIDTADINSIIYKVIWENVEPGPKGEYIEVIDYDPTIEKFYEQVDLNNPNLLAQDGLAPSESNPLFHQQMVYAVSMLTIKNFEKALGRKILWANRKVKDYKVYEEYVQRLRIYPHALRDANAYYSPQKKALLFGYFEANSANKMFLMPGSLVFTCLSHDIITHEITHAILDGIFPYYNEPTNPDVLAFHEAFADIIALFQHFTFPEVLKHQIAQTKGDLNNQNLLGKLAQQFGSAIGNYGSLRDAIGEYDALTKQWKVKEPNGNDYEKELEPHKRGSILVAAVFEAFLNIYKRRVADLIRISTNGSGILPEGELHPDLVNRLAIEASKTSQHVLGMCIRALDYCPPVDITFGEYLRAIITSDIDLMSDDTQNYRLAFIEAFRRRGIYPKGIKTLSEDSLKYKFEPVASGNHEGLMEIITLFLRDYRDKVIYETEREKIFLISRDFIGGTDSILGLHNRLYIKFNGDIEFEKLTGLVFNYNWNKLGIKDSKASGENNYNQRGPSFKIQNLRLLSRVGPEGNQIYQIVFSIIQRSGLVITDGKPVEFFIPNDDGSTPNNGFEFRGGCTMIFDLGTLKLNYCIKKPLLDMQKLEIGEEKIDENRAVQQFEYNENINELNINEFKQHFGIRENLEPFALIHKS
jgi:hypothetical protein